RRNPRGNRSFMSRPRRAGFGAGNWPSTLGRSIATPVGRKRTRTCGSQLYLSGLRPDIHSTLRRSPQLAMKLLLISSVVPANTISGNLILYRHLRAVKDMDVLVVSDGPVPGFPHKVLISKVGFHMCACVCGQ